MSGDGNREPWVITDEDDNSGFEGEIPFGGSVGDKFVRSQNGKTT